MKSPPLSSYQLHVGHQHVEHLYPKWAKQSLQRAYATQGAMLQGVKRNEVEGQIVSASRTSPAVPIESCGP